MTRSLVLLVALSLPAAVAAQDAPAPRPLEFTGDIGFVNTAGNTDVTTLNIGEKITHTRDRLTLRQSFALVYGRTEGETTTSLWRTGLRGDFALTPAIAAYASAAFDRNRFAGISRRLEEGLGIAVKLINRERNKAEIEGGLTLTQQRSTLDVDQNFSALRTAGLFQHNFNATSYIQQTVEVLPNLENGDDLRVNSETALVAPLSSRLALKVSYVIRYDAEPEPGFETTDRLLTSGLQITL